MLTHFFFFFLKIPYKCLEKLRIWTATIMCLCSVVTHSNVLLALLYCTPWQAHFYPNICKKLISILMHQLVEALSDLLGKLGNQSIDFEYNLPKRLLILAFRFHIFPSFCFYETSALNILNEKKKTKFSFCGNPNSYVKNNHIPTYVKISINCATHMWNS